MAFNFNWKPQKLPLQMINGNSRAASEAMAGYIPAEADPNNPYYTQGIPSENAAAMMQGYTEEQPAPYVGRTPEAMNNAGQGAGYQFNDPEYDTYIKQQEQAERDAADKKQQIADKQAQIKALETRIAENTKKLQSWGGVANQIAAIEARKINSQDPTMVWRWKVGQDEARRIANMEKEKTKSTQQNNVKFEIDNTLSSITPRSDASSEEVQRDITKLYDLRTLAQKNEMPKSEIDKIDARIESLRNPKSEISSETGEKKDIFDDMTNLNTPEKKNARVEQLLARPENTKPGDWAEVLKNPDGMNKDLVIKAKAEYGKALDRQKAEREAKEKEDTLLKKGKNLTSKDIEWLKGRKGLKYHTDDYGNEWFTRG